MFEEAAKIHFLSKCSVGGGSPGVTGKLHGMGCLLTDNHVLTAWHVWREIQQKYAWPVVVKYDGLYRCELVFEQRDADLLVLKAVEKKVDVTSAPPSRYPRLSAGTPFLGKTVGYLASLRIQEPDYKGDHTYFSPSCLSMFMRDTPGRAVHVALAGGLIQKGFSGGPVFEENGDVLGVLIQSLRFSLDPNNPTLSVATMPIMSVLFPYRDEIAGSLS